MDKKYRAPAAIFLIALAIRLAHVWQIRKAPFFDVLMGDSRGYDEWAQRLAGGEWIGRDVFYQAPLYPYFLGVIYAIAGRSLLLVRVCQAVVGAASCVLLAAAARRFFSPAVGVAAGLMLALYAPAIFFDGLIQKSVLDVFFVCLALYLIAGITTSHAESAERSSFDKLRTSGRRRSARGADGQIARSADGQIARGADGQIARGADRQIARGEPVEPRALRRSPWIWLGLALGGLSLTRENALVFIVVILAWSVWRGGLKSAAAFVAGVVIVLAPVAIRNSVVGGGFYVTTSQFGPNLYIGNHPGADGSYESLKYGRGAPEFERQDATDIAERAMNRPLTPAEVSSYWTERALDFLTGQPGAWLKLMGRKIVLLANRVEMVDTEDQATHADWSLPLRILSPIGTFGVIVPLAVVGLFATWCERRRLSILYALIVSYGASVVAFYVFARYRFPLVPLLLLFSAAGLVALRRPRLIPNPSSLIPAAIVAVVFTNWPVVSAQEMRAVTETNLGVALQSANRMDEAIASYRKAIADRPDYAPAYSNLATALRREHKTDEAKSCYEQALKLRPEFATAHYNLANLLLDEGQPAAAAEHFERAIREEPPSADVHNNLGIALAATGRTDDAVREFRAAIEVEPNSAKAYRNLGDALSSAGNVADAVSALRKAVEIDPTDASTRYDLASTLLEARQLDAAIAEFHETLRLAPRMVEAHNNLGIALGSEGKLDEAIAEFQRALEIQPGFADAAKNLDMARRARGQR